MGQIFAGIARRSLILEIIWVDLEIIWVDLKHFAKRINTDFIDFGGVERGPNAGNCCSELFFWNTTFLQFLSSLVVLWSSGAYPGGSKRGRAASKQLPRGHGKARALERWPESSRRGLDSKLAGLWPCHLLAFLVSLARLLRQPCYEPGSLTSKLARLWPCHLLDFPGYPKEEGLLDFLGRPGTARSPVQVSGLQWRPFVGGQKSIHFTAPLLGPRNCDFAARK